LLPDPIPIESFDLGRIPKESFILGFRDDRLLHALPDLFAELLLHEIYPLTQGIPFCQGEIQHMVEIFRKERGTRAFAECGACRLAPWCAYRGEGFTPRPIERVEPELQAWLDDENRITQL